MGKILVYFMDLPPDKCGFKMYHVRIHIIRLRRHGAALPQQQSNPNLTVWYLTYREPMGICIGWQLQTMKIKLTLGGGPMGKIIGTDKVGIKPNLSSGLLLIH